jgi:hypothetical protein
MNAEDQGFLYLGPRAEQSAPTPPKFVFVHVLIRLAAVGQNVLQWATIHFLFPTTINAGIQTPQKKNDAGIQKEM